MIRKTRVCPSRRRVHFEGLFHSGALTLTSMISSGIISETTLRVERKTKILQPRNFKRTLDSFTPFEYRLNKHRNVHKLSFDRFIVK